MLASHTSALYHRIDQIVPRSEGSSPAARAARALRQKWLEMEPAQLVEAALISALLIRPRFEAAFAVLEEAECVPGLEVSARSYTSLSKLALSQGKYQEVLWLLSRCRSKNIALSPTFLLNCMDAAACISDWGGVSRLFLELDGRTPSQDDLLYAELTGDPDVLAELRETTLKERTLYSRDQTLNGPPTMIQALDLALQANLEKGDTIGATEILQRMRSEHVVLLPERLIQILNAVRMGKIGLLKELEPQDVLRIILQDLDMKLISMQGLISTWGSTLGTVERALAAFITSSCLIFFAFSISGLLKTQGIDAGADFL